MKKISLVRLTLAIIASSLFFFTGCESRDTVGDKIEDAGKKTGEAVDDAGDKASDAIDDATQ